MLSLSAVCPITASEVFKFGEIVTIRHGKGLETESPACGKTQQEQHLRVCIFFMFLQSYCWYFCTPPAFRVS